MNPSLLDYTRYLSKQDRKTLSQKALKVAEETGELASVVLPLDNAYATTHRFVERQRILEESVDVVLTALSVAYDLNFTDVEIEEMMFHKLEKWAMLQHKESQVVYPLPYEIHITVSDINGDDPTNALQAFKDACSQVGVKPIVLDLQNQRGISVMDDVMTSSKHFGNNHSAFVEAQRISTALTSMGYNAIRTKVETVPWHPAAPTEGQPMPANCYFESHIPIIVTPDKMDSLSGDLPHNVHLSRNVFKRNDDGTVVIMGTVRSYDMSSHAFQQEVKCIVDHLTAYGYSLGKTHVEFAVYDTKSSHDTKWITS